jgi:hypothetical protein
MSGGPTPESGRHLLAPTAFRFVLGRELRTAMRSRSPLGLIVIQTTRLLHGAPEAAADDETVRGIAALLTEELRDRDLLGYTEGGTLSLVLRSADYSRTLRVVERLIARLGGRRFPIPVQVALGAACFPAHAMGLESLKRWAVSHPVARTHLSPDEN